MTRPPHADLAAITAHLDRRHTSTDRTELAHLAAARHPYPVFEAPPQLPDQES